MNLKVDSKDGGDAYLNERSVIFNEKKKTSVLCISIYKLTII